MTKQKEVLSNFIDFTPLIIKPEHLKFINSWIINMCETVYAFLSRVWEKFYAERSCYLFVVHCMEIWVNSKM